MDIEKFLDKKTTTYTFVKADELYDFLYEKENLLDNTIGENRDYIFALKENNIVGYAILFDTENKLYDALKNTYTLSNIAVAKDFRNKGIATGMIDLMLDEVKKSNRILIRTKPDLLGKLYTYNKITNNAKDKNVYFIPHNLSFIYKTIEKSGLFTNKKNEYKMNTK